jgi:hypothetical protein
MARRLQYHQQEMNCMRNWISVGLILSAGVLLPGCSRSDNRQQPGGSASTPVGYAPASTALATTPPAASASAPAEPAPAESEPAAVNATVSIPRGTPIHVRLDETVDTHRNRPGDVVHATLSQPLVVDGRTVVPAGARFTGHITMADASGRMKGRAHIGVAMDSFHLHGRQYRIATTTVERASAAHKKRNGILIGGGTGLGAALGAIAGGGQGALIGAGAGAAAGTAGAAATGKLNVAIAAETPLRFTLRSAVMM